MRDRIWANLQNMKFKSTYTANMSKFTHYIGLLYSFSLAIASASSVAAWAIWKIYPLVWAWIVGLSQVLHVAKPYVPFVKNDKEFMEMSLMYESLYLLYDKLWHVNEKTTKFEQVIEDRYYELRQQEIDLAERYKHIICPEFKWIMVKSSTETAQELALHFN